MISHKYKTIFVHVPKTGGQSIETFFLRLHGLDWDTRAPLLLRQNENRKIGPPRLAHLKAKEYFKYQYISKDLYDLYFKFSFIRNPWSRTVSFYKHFRYNRVLTFRDFVIHELPRLFDEFHWFVGPQYEYLYDGEEMIVDYVGKFKNLKSEFAYISKKLKLPKSTLPYINKGSLNKGIKYWKQDMKLILKNPKLILLFSKDDIQSGNYRDYYDKELVKIVGDLYQKDIELFNFKFE